MTRHLKNHNFWTKAQRFVAGPSFFKFIYYKI